MEAIVLVLSLGILGIQLVAWRWSLHLKADLRGRAGFELASLIAWVIGGITIARLLGTFWALAAGWTTIGMNDALVLTTVTQGMVAFVLLAAVWRVRRFSRDQTPVDGSSEAVSESEA